MAGWKKFTFMSCIRLLLELFVLTDTYQWELCIVCNGIMVTVYVLKLYEVETRKLGALSVCVSPENRSNAANINRLHWFVFPTAASAVFLLVLKSCQQAPSNNRSHRMHFL